jgi:hypothetical protein
MRGALALRYNTVKPFLALLGETSALGAATGGKRVLAGVKRLPALSRRKVGEKPAAAARDRRQAGAAGVAQGGVRQRRPAGGGRWTATRTWCACWSSFSAL